MKMKAKGISVTSGLCVRRYSQYDNSGISGGMNDSIHR
jgi:hypothetical protein